MSHSRQNLLSARVSTSILKKSQNKQERTRATETITYMQYKDKHTKVDVMERISS